MNKPKKKWKLWQKITLGVVLGVIAMVSAMPEEKAASAKDVKVDSTVERNKQIEASFSAWDGSHKKLKEFIKEQLNDPESFEMVSCNYWDRDSFLVVKMIYTAKNAFGGRVKNTTMAKCSLSGDVLEIMAHE